jgi:hypothetical protein
MIGFLGPFITITINYNSSQSVAKTHSIPYWTTSVFSSTVTNDERRTKTSCWRFLLPWKASVWWIFSSALVWPPFIASGEPNRGHRLQGFHYCSSWERCLGNVHEPLPSIWTSASVRCYSGVQALFSEPLHSDYHIRYIILNILSNCPKHIITFDLLWILCALCMRGRHDGVIVYPPFHCRNHPMNFD